MYDIRYGSGGKQDATHLRQTYGAKFVNDFDNWLRYLAEQAADPRSTASVDAVELFRHLADGPAQSRWQFAIERFADATLREKLRAINVVLARRCPPWEFRMSSAWFELVCGVSSGVDAYYLIDHANRRVVFKLIELVDAEHH